MLPLLRLVADGEEHRVGAYYSMLADHFGLSEEERTERLPSGKKTRLRDRVQWASTYLRNTKLLEATRRGHVRVTDRGREVLAESPDRIDLKYLSRFPELDEFRFRKRDEGTTEPSEPDSDDTTATPEEQLGELSEQLREALAAELLDQVKQGSPDFFEQLVVDLLVAMGYGGEVEDAGKTVGKSGDGGIDGIIRQDKLGLDKIYLQAKRWENNVSRPHVQGFAGSLDGVRARKGVFLTTSSFSREARDYVKQIEKKIVLIDGKQLARLMIEHNVGVSTAGTYVVKQVDSDYFEE